MHTWCVWKRQTVALPVCLQESVVSFSAFFFLVISLYIQSNITKVDAQKCKFKVIKYAALQN